MSKDAVPVGRKVVAARWLALIALSAALSAGLEAVHLPAALLLGPMAVAIGFSVRGQDVPMPPVLFKLAQAMVGVMIARAMPASVFVEMAAIWPILIGGVVFVVIISNGLGWLIAWRGVLPGTTAVWGAAPGAASAMVIMSDIYGGDMRLVALMQYVRVIMVASAASLVARLTIGGALAELPDVTWFPPLNTMEFAKTLAIIAGGLALAWLLNMATGAMILPMALAIGLQNSGLVTVTLPPWLLALAYALIGWSIGGRFTPAILAHAARALPAIVGSIAVLMAVCAAFGMALAHFAGIDPLTAYLATSPGGADAVAIIATSVPVDVPFVMAMQTTRFILVLLTGPAMARFLATRLHRGNRV